MAHTNVIILTGCILVKKLFLSCGLVGGGVVFIFNFSILEVLYAWVWLYRVVGFAIAVSGDFRGLPVVVGLFLTD